MGDNHPNLKAWTTTLGRKQPFPHDRYRPKAARGAWQQSANCHTRHAAVTHSYLAIVSTTTRPEMSTGVGESMTVALECSDEGKAANNCGAVLRRP